METQSETTAQQNAELETAPVEAAPEPEGQPAPVVEQMIQVAPGVAVTLSQYRAAADPLCRHCSQGIVTQRQGNKSIRRPCGCAARHILREMRKQMPPKETATVTRDLAKARQRVEEHLAVLRTEAAGLENDIEARTKLAKEAVEEAEAAVRVAEQLRKRGKERVSEARAAIDGILAEYEKRLGEAEREFEEENELLTARERGLAQAQAILDSAQAKASRADRDTEGARKRAANLRRRADAFEARNRDVLADPLTLSIPQEQGGEPDAAG